MSTRTSGEYEYPPCSPSRSGVASATPEAPSVAAAAAAAVPPMTPRRETLVVWPHEHTEHCSLGFRDIESPPSREAAMGPQRRQGVNSGESRLGAGNGIFAEP